MKNSLKTSLIFYSFIIILFTSSSIFGQEFNNIENIEKLFTLTSKQVDSTLLSEGYTFKNKDIKSKISTYQKSISNNKHTFIINITFKENKLHVFMWEDYIHRASFMISDLNKNYIINELKTNDNLGIFYLESKTLDLDAVIFKTIANVQNGKIAFKISKREKLKK